MPVEIIKNSSSQDIPVEISEGKISLKNQFHLDAQAANLLIKLIKIHVDAMAKNDILVDISITDCKLSSNHPFVKAFIPAFTKITQMMNELNLSNNNLGAGEGLRVLLPDFNLSSGLKKIRLANNNLTNNDDEALAHFTLRMKYLETIDISHNKKLSQIPQLLVMISKLKKNQPLAELNLSYCGFKHEGLPHDTINTLPVIKLDISGNPLNSQAPSDQLNDSVLNRFGMMQIAADRVENDNVMQEANIANDSILPFIDIKELGKLTKTQTRGSFGPFYAGIYQQQKVLVKALEISDSYQNDEVELVTQEFNEEAHKLSKIKHPNIIRYFGNSIYQDQNVIIIESCEKDLSKYLIDKNHALYPNWKECVSFVKQLVEGLAYLHQNNVVHGKICPENIGVQSGTVKIMDFESVNTVQLVNTTRRSSSRNNNKYVYQAPEQLLQNDTLSYAADIYSLGMVVYSMLAGHSPFKDCNINQVKEVYTKQWLDGLPSSEKPVVLPKEIKNDDVHAVSLKNVLPLCFHKQANKRAPAFDILKHFTQQQAGEFPTKIAVYGNLNQRIEVEANFLQFSLKK